MEKESFHQRKEEDLFQAPNKEGNVWPHQSCPAFTPRKNAVIPIKECWYCTYADFHLDRGRALDVGVCEWPRKLIMKNE